MIRFMRRGLPRLMITVSVPIILVMLAVRLVMSNAFLRIEYNRPGFPDDTYGFTLEQRLEYAPPAIAYLLNNADISYLADLRLPRDIVPITVCEPVPESADLCSMYNARELKHMEDVKAVSRGAYIAGIIAAIVFIVASIWLFTQQARQAWYRSLFSGGVTTLSLMAAIIVGAVFAWELFFTGFHRIFFDGDSWLFRYSDTLIRLFPEQFWFDAALVIGVLVAAGAITLVVIGFRGNNREARHNAGLNEGRAK